MSSICPICKSAASDSPHIVRNGYFRRKSDGQILSRYHCRSCRKYFSTATDSPCFGQKRRNLNYKVYSLLSSGVSLRRIAILLNCSRTTVDRKFAYLASVAKAELLSEMKVVQDFQFDDIETFEHSKCKPVSITLAVETDSRRILGFSVSPIAAKGKLAKISRKKYGKRLGRRQQGRERLFEFLAPRVESDAIIRSDQDPHYPRSVSQYFPHARHVTTKGRRGCVVGQGELKSGGFDPIFSLNHTAAMLRANMNRLFRRTWCTTKTLEGLERHLWVYAHFHNSRLLQNVRASAKS